MILFYLRLILQFITFLQIVTGSEGTQITFPYFPDDAESFTTYGDVAYNAGNQSNIINAGASATGSCGQLLYRKKVRIQDVATGRVASFSTSFSFTFTTHGVAWDNTSNTKDGSGMAFKFLKSTRQVAMATRISQVGQFSTCQSPRSNNRFLRSPEFVGLYFDTDYDPVHHDDPSNNFIEFSHHGGGQGYYENDEISAYTHNLCGNDTHCSYFANGRVFTAWIDFASASQTLEVRLSNGSDSPKPLQPLLLIKNYRLPKALGDDVYLTFVGSSDINHVEAHEILSWSFYSSEILSSRRLLHFAKGTNISVGLFGVVVVVILLLSILWFARPSRNYAMGYLAGPRVFSYGELRKATENFDEKNLLGSGGSSCVYRGCLDSGHFVAVKQINFPESKQAECVFRAEVTSLCEIRHRNVVQLQGWCQEKARLLLVYDYMPNGSLNEWLHSRDRQTVLSLQLRHSILEEVGGALEYLHEDCSSCVLHRDIKSSNVLLDVDFKAHLADFGLARLMDHHKLDKTTLAAGTLGYMAPEMPYTGKATKKSDVYSFGILVLEVVCRRRPIDLQAVEPEDLVLLYSVWRAHEAGSLFSMVDPRLLERPSVPADSQSNMSDHHSNMIPMSTVVDVDFEVQKTMVVHLLHLGLLCCLPNPKTRPSMRQVNKILRQIRDMENVDSVISSMSMPSLPATKPLGVYRSLEFSQIALSASCTHGLSLAQVFTSAQAFGSLRKDD